MSKLLFGLVLPIYLANANLPTRSHCEAICPDCDSPQCTCPKGACWPGRGLDDTPFTECECFAQLGFCKDGEKPEFKAGEKCPSCWPGENKACDCFAVLGFCDAQPSLVNLNLAAQAPALAKEDVATFSPATVAFLFMIAMVMFMTRVTRPRPSQALSQGLLDERV